MRASFVRVPNVFYEKEVFLVDREIGKLRSHSFKLLFENTWELRRSRVWQNRIRIGLLNYYLPLPTKRITQLTLTSYVDSFYIGIN